MKKATKVIIALVCVAAAGRLAQAADNGTEFGVEDDLTVLGTGGTALDPDLEVKGFTVFGSTQSAPALGIPVAPGNIFANGYVQVSSGMYVAGSSTFTQAVELQGYGVLKSTVQFMNNAGALTNLYFDNGAANAGKVLKASANGFLTWETDNTGLASLGSPYRLQMVNAAGTGLVDSQFIQNAGATNITMVSGSSMTILGDGTDGLGVNGAAKFTGNVNLGDAAGDAITAVGALTAQNGLSVTGGNAAVTNDLTVNGNAQLGNAVTDTHAMNRAVEAGVALSVDSVGTSGNYAAKFYSGGSLAAWIKKK
ncbi:MAG: hypothetical protein M0011_09095 [Elusimicrobia bacterium]|nr:hypothetical protein [Elusimicrobiota bacterium]